jgi:hypothetical protein
MTARPQARKAGPAGHSSELPSRDLAGPNGAHAARPVVMAPRLHTAPSRALCTPKNGAHGRRLPILVT